MDVSATGNTGSVMDVYSKLLQSDAEQNEKLAKLQIEQKMKSDQMAMAEAALLDFYA